MLCVQLVCLSGSMAALWHHHKIFTPAVLCALGHSDDQVHTYSMTHNSPAASMQGDRVGSSTIYFTYHCLALIAGFFVQDIPVWIAWYVASLPHTPPAITTALVSRVHHRRGIKGHCRPHAICLTLATCPCLPAG